eukprot:jgi/Picre1/30730/NNA_006091.t1
MQHGRTGYPWKKKMCPHHMRQPTTLAAAYRAGSHPDNENDDDSCPLVDAVVHRASKDWEKSFHVPGHKKGNGITHKHRNVLGDVAFRHDTTELQGLDNLQQPEGVILKAMEKASALWGSEHTWFLVNGATVGIQAAIMATCYRGADDCLILARNAHQSAINGAIMAGCSVVYARNEYSYGIAHHVTPEAVEEAFIKAKDSGCCPRAALIVSPTYFGVQSDIVAIQKVCNKYGAVCIVDEAHGAHLAHVPNCLDALAQGAHLVIQSTHKQLSSLTQSSMLHAQNIPQKMKERLDRVLKMLQSSSPSYLLLSSLDAARYHMEDKAAVDEPHAAALHIHSYFNKGSLKHKDVEISLLSSLVHAPRYDPWRITLVLHHVTDAAYITGWSIATLLENERGIVAEMATHNAIVYACGIGTRLDDAQALTDSLDWLIKEQGIKHLSVPLRMISEEQDLINTNTEDPFGDERVAAALIAVSCQQPATVPRDVYMSDSIAMPLEQSVSCIAAETITVYPPGIPILVPGDVITADHVRYIQKLKQTSSSSLLIGGNACDTIQVMDVFITE